VHLLNVCYAEAAARFLPACRVESEVDVATALTRAPGALALSLDRERDP
jgi:hypothetical protein